MVGSFGTRDDHSTFGWCLTEYAWLVAEIAPRPTAAELYLESMKLHLDTSAFRLPVGGKLTVIVQFVPEPVTPPAATVPYVKPKSATCGAS